MGKSVEPFMKKRKAKEKGVTDKLAAQVILQGFFDEI
jgi:RNase H-fold protein (predicted Holliday junction resolvase)